MDLHYEIPGGGLGGWLTGTRGYLWLRLIGPGRVAMQSVFERIEGEDQYSSGIGGGGNFGSGLATGLAVEGLFDIAGSIFDSGGDNS
jgi:hypothetical protein